MDNGELNQLSEMILEERERRFDPSKLEAPTEHEQWMAFQDLNQAIVLYRSRTQNTIWESYQMLRPFHTSLHGVDFPMEIKYDLFRWIDSLNLDPGEEATTTIESANQEELSKALEQLTDLGYVTHISGVKLVIRKK